MNSKIATSYEFISHHTFIKNKEINLNSIVSDQIDIHKPQP
ncbi:hypothetical protein HMP0015_0396 [Acinetobacter haemolyticus ATCC 19194]|uniref:Uncharacterized protein n=1 Tax=Acinetobacter haemolyticus ATCC 19194 TaxID=707232 RepID=D4XL04_ACIHA|nr:hypothetical protein HMP0015_0396 [Acinetobacter haemolyticus ATCC 19194]